MDKVMRIFLSLFIAATIYGCGDSGLPEGRYEGLIVGFGDVKLGGKASSEWGSKKTNFMFFEYVGSRATAKSLQRYSVYYTRRFYNDIQQGFPMRPDQEKEALSSVKYLVEILSEKYNACTTHHFSARERPANPEFIASVADEWCKLRDMYMVFEAIDKKRHVGLFVKDDGVEIPLSKSVYRREIFVLVVAWDDDLMRLNEVEKKALAYNGL